MHRFTLVAAAACLAIPARAADDTVSFITLVDDGTVADTPFDTNEHANTVVNKILSLYQENGAPMPAVMSVWTAFPFNGGSVSTNFVPIANDVTGIGLENAFGAGQEVFASPVPPLRAMLIHNDVTQLESRAQVQGISSDGFGEYLFLLEVAHMFGPEINLSGAPADRLIGFPFHWSFFVDAGGSPIGGNAWTDNGDGTFTAPTFSPSTVTYSPLDLYLMGLGPSTSVAPFGLITGAVIPADAIDPFTNRAVTAATFPWHGPDPLTVTATRESITIDDVIAQNGPRVPAFGDAPTSFQLGIALLVPQGTSDDDLATIQRTMAPLAANLAPAFARATGDAGTMVTVTSSPAPPPLTSGDPDDSGPVSKKPAPSGCSSVDDVSAFAALVLAFALAGTKRVTRRTRRDQIVNN